MESPSLHRRRGRSLALGAAVALSLLLGATASRPASGQTVAGASSTTSTTSRPVGCAVAPIALPRQDRPRYVVSVIIDRAKRVVRGHIDVTFQPDRPIGELVLRAWADAPDADAATDDWGASPRVKVTNMKVRARTIAMSRPDPTTIVVRFSPPVRSAQRIEASYDYELRLPLARNERIATGEGWMRLGSFLPLLAWEPGVGWSRTPATTAHAEATMFPAADFTMTVTPPSDGTAPWVVLANGAQDEQGTWRVTGARDVAVSVGRFRVVEGEVEAGSTLPVKVRLGVPPSMTTADAQSLLDRTAELLSAEADRYGVYPWPTLTIALTPALRGGIEYPGHIMLGSPSDTVISHELGHQWFYGLVGNDQGRDPWLDEGLASWVQARALDDIDTFVQRVDGVPSVRAHMTDPMTYWDRHTADYSPGVYQAPVAFLASLGSPADVDCALRDYVARNAYAIATPGDLLSVLQEHFPRTYRAAAARFGITA